MPVLRNPKHEAVAQGLFKGLSAVDAYEQAGYKPNRSHAARLVAKGNIRDRVAELQERASEKAEWTRAERLAMLHEIALKSQSEDPRTSIAAIAETNKMQGDYAPSKTELTGKNGGPIETKDATAEALIDEAKRLGIDPALILGEAGRAQKA